MKKIKLLLSIFFALFSVSAYSQTTHMNLDSYGTVSIGPYNTSAYGKLKMGYDGVNNGISLYDYRYGGTPFNIYRSSNDVYITRGAGVASGMKMNSAGKVTMGAYNNGTSYVGGILTVVAEDNVALRVYGKQSFNQGDILKISTTNHQSHAIALWNTSHKCFFVTGEGEVYSNFQLITSDVSTKKNIETIESALDKVVKLRGVTFDSKLTKNEEISINEASVGIPTDTDSIDAAYKSSPAVLKQINLEKKRKHMGVVAQEVEAVVPEVVRTTYDGTKAVSYTELVGLLIEAIKEQQTQIDRLQELIPETKIGNDVTAMEGVVVGTNQLYQNVPNPFSVSTEIRYFLEENVVNANLYIYDMQGKQIKNINNLLKGAGSITIEGYELNPGMYIYALIADGKEIATKRMIVTN